MTDTGNAPLRFDPTKDRVEADDKTYAPLDPRDKDYIFSM